MVENLLLNKRKGRERPVARVGEGLVPAVPLHAEERGRLPGTVVAEPVAEPVAVRETEAPVIMSPTRNLPSNKFGVRHPGPSPQARRRPPVPPSPHAKRGRDGDLERSAPNDAAQQKPPEGRPAGADETDDEGEGHPDDVAVTDVAPP